MTPLPATVTDAELVAFIDRWVGLVEQGDYDAAFALTDHLPEFGWTPDTLRETIQWCGPFDPNRRVTLAAGPARRAEVNRSEPTGDGFFGEVCYWLDIDGQPSDRAVTFLLKSSPHGVTVYFEGIK